MERSFNARRAEDHREEEVRVTCQRCDGLVVREQYDNLEFDSAGYEIAGWRCLNCGAIVDPVIATHRHTTHGTEPDHLLIQRLQELVMIA